MKRWCVTTLLCGAGAWSAFGQGAPAPAAPVAPAAAPAPVARPAPMTPPAPPAAGIVLIDGAPANFNTWTAGAKEKAVTLGANSSPASAAIREQLKLPRGVGLVVESVEK